MVLPLYAAIEQLDPQLREASANLGARPAPDVRIGDAAATLPGVLTGCMFVFVPSLGNFVIPELLGGGKIDHGRQPDQGPVPQGARLAVRRHPRARR